MRVGMVLRCKRKSSKRCALSARTSTAHITHYCTQHRDPPRALSTGSGRQKGDICRALQVASSGRRFCGPRAHASGVCVECCFFPRVSLIPPPFSRQTKKRDNASTERPQTHKSFVDGPYTGPQGSCTGAQISSAWRKFDLAIGAN